MSQSIRLAPTSSIQDTPLVLTCTTTGAATLTLADMTVAAGKTVIVDWGDGNTDTYTAGAGARTHAYSGAGTWTVKLAKRRNIKSINFDDSKITVAINSANPLPVGLTYLRFLGIIVSWVVSPSCPVPAGLTSLIFYSVVGTITWVVSPTCPMPAGLINLTLVGTTGITWLVDAANPMPTGLTALYLSGVPGLTWEINAAQPWPAAATSAVIQTCLSVTCTAWTNTTVRSIQWESSCNAAKVDSILAAIWANKANFTYATPTLDLLGGSNAAPNGAYQAASPPTTGKEFAYDLVNGSYTPAGPEWTVQTA